MSYRYPYGNTEQMNLDWFLNQWEKFKADWAEAEAGIDGSLDAEIAKVEAAMSELYAARDAAAASATAARQSSLDAAAAQVAAGNSKTAAQAAETAARGSQQAAAQSAQEAQASAQGAENSALTASQAANTATQQAAGADAAKGAAEAAQQAAEDAQAAAAQSAGQAGDHADDAADSATLAQQAAQDMSDSVEQITTNKNDISDLKESANELKTAITQLESQSGSIAKTIENVPIASFNDGTASAVKQIVVGIEPYQAGSGDASPENQRPIYGWTGANVTKTGKNIVNWEITTSGPYDTILNGYGNGKWQPKMDVPKSFLGKIFTYSAFITVPSSASEAGRVAVYFFDENNVLISSSSGTTIAINNSGVSSITFTIPLNAKQYALGIFIPVGAVAEKPMLEYGSNVTDYEQYTGTTYPITFPTEAGTVYGGTLTNLGTNEWKLRVDRTKKALNGTENWSAYPAQNGFVTAIPDMASLPTAQEMSAFSKASWLKNILSLTEYGILFNINTTLFCCHITDNISEITDLDTWKAYLSTNPLEIVYPITTSAEYTITTAEVIELLAGYNNVWADTGNINLLEYYANSKSYIDNQNVLVKALIAPMLDSMIADTALAINDFRIVNNTLYRVTAPIASGGTLTVGTNVTATTVAEVLKSLLN